MIGVPLELEHIDAVYRRVEAFVLPRNQPDDVTIDQSLAHQMRASEAIEAYHTVLKQFQSLYPRLTADEIIAAFHQGSELLRRNLAGRMARDFAPIYRDTMVASVRAHQDQIASIFLQVLVREDSQLGRVLVAEAINSSSPLLRETAIYLAGELDLKNLIWHLNQLSQDTVPEVARAAQRVLAGWA